MRKNRRICSCNEKEIVCKTLKMTDFLNFFCTSHRKCDILPLQVRQVSCPSVARGNRYPCMSCVTQTKQNQISITMKKTIITLLALAGAAVAGEEITLTLPDSQTVTLETTKLDTSWSMGEL